MYIGFGVLAEEVLGYMNGETRAPCSYPRGCFGDFVLNRH